MARPYPFLVAALLLPWQASAQAPAGNTIGLTDAQKAKILSHDTEQTVADARTGLPGSGRARGIHGEIGMGIGTNGYRDTYGAAAIPLGDHASATVMFEDERYGRR